jgi:hypothetical protein
MSTTGGMPVGEGPAAVRAAHATAVERWAIGVKAAGIEPQ